MRKAWILVMVLLFLPAAASKVLDKDKYLLGETVRMNFSGIPSDIPVFIMSEHDTYNIIGASKVMHFTPKNIGEYVLVIGNSTESFLVDREDLIGLSKKQYILGDEVMISLKGDMSGKTVSIVFEGNAYTYMDAKDKMKFMPKSLGEYNVIISEDGEESDSEIFEVVLKDMDSLAPKAERFLPQPKIHKVNAQIKGVGRKIDSKIKLIDGNVTHSLGEDVYEGIYDAEIEPKISGIKKISLHNLRFNGTIDIGLEEADVKINNKKTLRSFSIDPRTSFEKGIVTATAVGTNLWKCKDWDFQNQRCLGTWEMIRKLNPGEEYDIMIDANDPGFAETGVATVNSRKSIYLPGEAARLIMIVLDTSGYPVSGADVTLKIKSPDDSIYTLTSEIDEISKGAYEAEFIHTDLEGTYNIQVVAKGNNVDSNLSSNFTVSSSHGFDIIREIPSVIDPYKGKFESRLKVISRISGVETFNLTEALPRDISIYDYGDAVPFTTIDDNVLLRWSGLKNGSTVSYSFSTPTKAPNVYSIGEALVSYDAGYFLESRPWYLAIDPPARNGIFTYRDTTATSTIKYRIWYSGNTTYSNERTGPNIGTAIFSQKVRCTRENNMCIWVGGEDDNSLNVVIYNVTSDTWSTITNLGGQGKDDHFPIDVECEDLSGNCLIVYESTTALNDIIYYRIFYASNASLSNEFSYTSTPLDSNDLDWVKLYPQYNSNYIGIAMQTDGEAQVAAIWNGTAIRDSQLLFDPSSNINGQATGCAWEGSSGDFVCFYGRNANGLWAYTYNGGWTDNGQVISATELGHIAYSVYACGESSFTGNLNHNKMVVLVGDSGSDLYGTFWNGTALDTAAEPAEDGTSEIGYYDTAVCEWEHDGATAAIQWVDSNSLIPEWGTFTESSNTFSNADWSAGSTTGMSQWNDDVEALSISLHPYTDEMIIAGTSLASATSASFNASRWTGSTFSNTGLGGIEETVSTSTTGNQEFMRMGSFDWIRYDDIKSPNISLVYPKDELVTANKRFNFNWTVTDNKDKTLLCNLTINGQINQSAISSNNRRATNLTVYNFPAGEYDWNITCWDDFWNYNVSRTFTYVVAGTPIITIRSVGGDLTSVYTFTDQTPIVNASIHLNSTCYLSEVNETYPQMVSNGRVNCGSYVRNIPKTCEYTNSLTAGSGTDYLFMACNTTFGNYSVVPKQMDLTVECDAHSDCVATKYCSQATKQCVNDVLTGFSCESVGIGAVPSDEVCKSGSSGANPTAKCVNDTTYSYTGWYCTSDSDDCVYNNNGNSYDLNYRLCDPSSDYRSCSSSNRWDTLVDCAALNDGSNQTAITHAFGYCGYFASAQTCTSGDQDLGSYGCQGSPTDCGSYVYSGAGSCGSVLADCDIGCGATCDTSNSTAPGLSGGICYYGKSCSNACAWSVSTETAPDFCINDYDGGSCVLSSRTDPSIQDTCYYVPTCLNTIGANMTKSGMLRQDYCDTCNASGNFTGGYAPAPNASCTTGCANTGTIYYDSGLTPGSRNDDCNDGISAILTDTLAIGDVWNASAPAYCNNAECDLDCGTLFGACTLGICGCVDNDNPSLVIFQPYNNSWDNDGTVVFSYNVTDISSGIENCSLYINDSFVSANSTIREDLNQQTFSAGLVNGTYDWYIVCFDDSANINSNISSKRRLGVDTSKPYLSSPGIDGISFSVNQQICLNITVSDTFSGIASVFAEIQRPDLSLTNLSLSDTATSCDQGIGNGIYSVSYNLQYAGEYSWQNVHAFDVAYNLFSIPAGFTWNVTAGGVMNASMPYPSADILINESEYSNSFFQTCSVTCNDQGVDCHNVTLFAQYMPQNDFLRVNQTTEDLVNAENDFFCGNLAAEGAPWWNSSWENRKQLEITNNNLTRDMISGYSIKLILNTTGPLYQDDGDDIRIVYWNGSENLELDRVNLSSFNTAATQIWFAAYMNITPGGSDSNYYIYYNNTIAAVPPNNASKVFRYYNYGDNTNGWTAYGTGTSIASSGSYLTLTATANNYNTAGVYYGGLVIGDMELDLEFYITSGEYVMMYARGNTGNTYYTSFLDINDPTLTANHLRYMNAGAGTNLVENDQITNDIALSTWHNYTFSMVGPSLKSYVDGILESQATHSSLSSGRIGLHDQIGSFRVRNIRVRDLMHPVPSTVLSSQESYPLDNSSCTHTFSVSSGSGSGNNTWPIRCMVKAENAATVYSGSINVTINDHPVALIVSPIESEWVTGNYSLNASSSYDSDGTIINYQFEIDSQSDFSAPEVICSTQDSNCTFDTGAQTACPENNLCYVRISIEDDLGLTSSRNISFWIDNLPPEVELTDPLNFTNISSDYYTLSASVNDGGIGADTAYFEFRKNNTAAWNFACLARDSPYECTLNTTGFTDGNGYQIRVSANDTLGHLSSYSTVYNITILKTGPTIMLKTPFNNTYTKSYNQSFFFNVSSRYASIYSCVIYLDGQANESLYEPSELKTNNLTVMNLSEQTYSWYIQCIDSLSNINVSDARYLHVDRTGPLTFIDEPDNFENISGNYRLNATVIDAVVGENTTTFFFRKNNLASWAAACIDHNVTNDVASCLFDTTVLDDSRSYEFWAYSNDSLGNVGGNSTKTNITIDNSGPRITLISPNNGATDGDGTIFFQFSVNDTISGIRNCSLMINNSVNQTISNIPEGSTVTFNVTNLNTSTYFWNVTCYDDYIANRYNSSQTRTLFVDIRYEMQLDIASDKMVYQLGNQLAETAVVSNNVTDFYNQSIDASIITDFIIGNTSVPWWNTSWERRKQIVLEEYFGTAKNNETVLVNLTGLLGYIDDCREIRIVDRNTSREVAYNISIGDDSSFCTVKFPAFVSAYTNSTRYMAYFNNSGATIPSYSWKPIEKYSINLMLESFEDGNVWPPAASGCIAGTPSAGMECTDGFGNYSNCDDNTDDYMFACSSNGARYGTYTFILADWDTFAYTRGLWYNVNPTTACRGQCEDINVRFYTAPVSIDASTEYCVVWVNDQDTSGQELYRCNGATTSLGDNGCESTANPPAIGDYDLESYNLSSYGSLQMTANTEIHMGGRGTATNDYCYYDDFKVNGITTFTTEVRSRARSTEQFKARNTGNTVLGNYDFNKYMNMTIANYSIVSKANKTRYYDAKDNYLIEILSDYTAPVISLNSPLNGTTSNSSVTFTYRVNDTLSSVSNCSLYIDKQYQSMNMIIEEGNNVQYFFPRIPAGGAHLWNVTCSDYYGNIGWSEAWTVIIIPPDFYVNRSTMKFDKVPIEGLNISLNVTVKNIGGSDATNVTVTFYRGSPSLNFVIETFKVNLTERTGNRSTVTLNTSWVVSGPGPFTFFAVADPPLATNGSIREINETNNQGNITLDVAGWHYYYGNASGNIKLENSGNASKFLWNVTGGNVYIVETGTSISWQDIHALGRDVNDIAMFNDFKEADTALNMTGYLDSINATFTYNNAPKQLMQFSVYQTQIDNVPIVNSTNSSNFITGILWDSSDLLLSTFNGTQDLVFITEVNNGKQGKYGTYDYEIRVPAALDTYKLGSGGVTFYTEII